MPPSKHYRTSSFKQVAGLILNIPLLKDFAQNGFLIVFQASPLMQYCSVKFILAKFNITLNV